MSGLRIAGVLLLVAVFSQTVAKGAESASLVVAANAVELLRRDMESGTPIEKQNALNVVRDLKPLALVPNIIKAIEDATALPRDGDTGWGFVGHQAATIMGEIAQTIDGLDVKARGRVPYSFFNDEYKGSEELKKLGRLLEVRNNWNKWWQDLRATKASLGEDPSNADPAPLRIVAITSSKEVKIKQPFPVELRVENTSSSNQTFRVMSCSWDQHWQCDNTALSWIGFECWKNSAIDVNLAPKEAYTNTMNMLITGPHQIGKLSFRMGFTPLGSARAYWSEEVVFEIKP
jgi:hypothetical protein